MRRFVHNPALVNASKYGKDFRKISPGMHNDGGTGKVTSMGLPKLSPATRMEYGVNGVGGLAGKQSFTCDFLIRKHPLKTLRRRQSEVFSSSYLFNAIFPLTRGSETEEEKSTSDCGWLSPATSWSVSFGLLPFRLSVSYSRASFGSVCLLKQSRESLQFWGLTTITDTHVDISVSCPGQFSYSLSHCWRKPH